MPGISSGMVRDMNVGTLFFFFSVIGVRGYGEK
jgi:hypothetical protein